MKELIETRDGLSVYLEQDSDPQAPEEWDNCTGEALRQAWKMYHAGDVWGYIVEDSSGEHLDSCWGFYGYEER